MGNIIIMISSLATLSILSLLAGVKVMGSMDLQCTHSAKLDLQLIVDSSLSVGKEKFQLLMEEIADRVVGQFDIGKDKTRVSLFKYSSRMVMVEEFELDAHSDAASLKKAIKATKFVGGWTMTAMAMQKAFTHYSAKMRNDKATAKACIVFTDGEASDKDELPAALKAWGSKGVKVFAVGIGKKIDAAGLEAVTGSAYRFIQVPSIEAFSEAAAKFLLIKVCEETIAATRPVADLSKSAKKTASSYYGAYKAKDIDNLVDGRGSTTWDWFTCFHTQKQTENWILFQFDKPRFIKEVVITNRVDSMKGRLFPFELLVTNELGQVHKCQGKSFKVGDPEIPSVNTNPISINCGYLRGNSVKLVIKDNWLNICEFKIIGN